MRLVVLMLLVEMMLSQQMLSRITVQRGQLLQRRRNGRRAGCCRRRGSNATLQSLMVERRHRGTRAESGKLVGRRLTVGGTEQQPGRRPPLARRRAPARARRAAAVLGRAAGAADRGRVRVGPGLGPVRPRQQFAVRPDDRRHALLLLAPVAEPDAHHFFLELEVVGQVRDLLRRRLGLLDEVRLQRSFHRHLDARSFLPLTTLYTTASKQPYSFIFIEHF